MHASASWRLLFFLIPLALGAAAPDARQRYYTWPPPADYPNVNGPDFWDWHPESASQQPKLLSLRRLNEAVAGQDGWVSARGDKLYLGNGQPVRFWAVDTTGDAPLAQLTWLADGLADRGVNLIRIHGGASKSLLDFKAGGLDAVNQDVIDQMQKAVVAAKQAGIYIFASNEFFIIEYKVKASDGLAGYTQEWLDAHPDQHVPFGLIFLNDALRNAYKGWLRTFVTSPNPYDPQHTPLARDPAVAVIELLNEENVFFWTFRPEFWPPEQRALVGAKFFDWVARRYHHDGDADHATAVRRALAVWQAPLAEDAIERGQLGVMSAGDLGHRKEGARRIADQLEWLHDVQRGFYVEMAGMLRDLGYRGLISPSNWATANDAFLTDIEHDTYRVGGLIDRHAYYSPVSEKTAQSWRLSVGDRFLAFSATATPGAASFNVRQTAGYPSAMSEFSWVNYNPAGAEAPLMAAAYFSLTDFDMPIWFALPDSMWSNAIPMWPVGDPATLGQFPGAALLFRRGDVTEAPVVVREGRTLATLYQREPALLMPGRGFDATRDTAGKTEAKAQGRVDPLAMLTGKVEVTYDTDADVISPELPKLIDREQGRVRSITGQVTTDWHTGLTTVDTPRSQGIAGFLRANGRVALHDVAFTSENVLGALLAISLDEAPLAQSKRILLQAGTMDRPTGFRTKPVKLTHEGRDYTGYEIASLGHMPWQVERIAAQVVLKGMAGRVKSAVVLDEDGRSRGAISGEAHGADYVIQLPGDSLYTVVELK